METTEEEWAALADLCAEAPDHSRTTTKLLRDFDRLTTAIAARDAEIAEMTRLAKGDEAGKDDLLYKLATFQKSVESVEGKKLIDWARRFLIFCPASAEARVNRLAEALKEIEANPHRDGESRRIARAALNEQRQ